ncbi:hypothetical protein [Kineothrix alysoides]|uniref:hypothetical protein n=1 Tax=Kineothrix alysoides TaxID=1469948 RepID=UPI0004DB81B2|nr:hypothetical protein [Kineothrix alysoides]
MLFLSQLIPSGTNSARNSFLRRAGASGTAGAERIIYLEDGFIKEELILGKYDEARREEREKRAAVFMRKWLKGNIDKSDFL